ncbi:TDP-N-acetylfucosamine:lipid II N-acetylfucosaminyltransferase [Flavobacterium dankookense]|uniref:4-alpha-L-fucosyltransferase (Glycosyl transferase family 56) n=1 Tax=Flavobacterium dankookense TaxID=706186 RepID=A0A4R6Q9B3_9FLAO|nr:TDP-N-acetylfucosamine:lipid II N-acetylfucosaminyltransferase [Flavobacterium dankookense]TDP59214.1 4-alpha-L-fucosyltransferase (glycosyl transferase family 56) [Flavobacterium dankookense]
MKYNIIHICEDEKFINSAINQFEIIFPNQNKFYIVDTDNSIPFRHVTPSNCTKSISTIELVQLSETLDKSSLVILHSLSSKFYSFVLKLSKEIKIVWLCFGFEVYNDSYYYKNNQLLDKITLKKYPSNDKTLSWRKKIRPLYRIIKPNLPFSDYELKRKAIQRVNYLGSTFHDEYVVIQKLLNVKKDFFNFWYYPLEQIVEINSPINFDKTTMLIGNSGFKSLNHLDVFDRIKNYNLKASKVIIPLNYGVESYINDIVEQSNLTFGEKSFPLLNFLSLSDYNELLNNVGIAIFNNHRQQALGNTIALLWFGVKIFLSEQNPFYTFLKRNNIHIFSYENELNENSCNTFLTQEEIEQNRYILFKLLQQDVVTAILKKHIDTIYA